MIDQLAERVGRHWRIGWHRTLSSAAPVDLYVVRTRCPTGWFAHSDDETARRAEVTLV
ncbi:MAG: hypothetical protein ACRDT0_15190 [Pseudonocardiaceae bacterium]